MALGLCQGSLQAVRASLGVLTSHPEARVELDSSQLLQQLVMQSHLQFCMHLSVQDCAHLHAPDACRLISDHFAQTAQLVDSASLYHTGKSHLCPPETAVRLAAQAGQILGLKVPNLSGVLLQGMP